MRQFNTLLYIVALFSCSLVFACNNHFAHLTSYPIMRTYPTKWIEDSLEMLSFFPIMADDSLKNVLKRTKPSDWEQVGWRGYTFANGV